MSIGVFLLLSDCMPIGFFSLDVVSATVQCRYHLRLMRSVGNAIMSLCYVCVNVAIIGESPSQASRHRKRVSNKYEGFAIPLVFPPVLLPGYPTLPYPLDIETRMFDRIPACFLLLFLMIVACSCCRRRRSRLSSSSLCVYCPSQCGSCLPDVSVAFLMCRSLVKWVSCLSNVPLACLMHLLLA